VRPQRFIPVSAILGENLAARGAGMPGTRGRPCWKTLDGLAKAPTRNDQPMRVPVQAVYKFTAAATTAASIAGRVEAGQVRVGDKVVFSPRTRSAP